MAAAAYERAIKGWIDDAVRWQEEIGLDVLVHGEFERNDMVKYFGEQLSGFAFTQHGWVQSLRQPLRGAPDHLGRRLAPSADDGAVVRLRAVAARTRPMKGMLTGPVTMLQWSFVRDDVPRETVCRQIALAIRDEVADLEAAGIGVIQVDEPAFREGLPLRQRRLGGLPALGGRVLPPGDLRRARRHQRSTPTCATRSSTTSWPRSRRWMLMRSPSRRRAAAWSCSTPSRPAGGWRRLPRGNRAGSLGHPQPARPEPPRNGGVARAGAARLKDWQIWVNPDCGLKTRRWEEVRPALENLVAAARQLREERVASV